MPASLKTLNAHSYDRDFYAWTQDQGMKLRARAAFDNRGDIDWENAAEEIESLGRSDKKEVRTRLGVLLKHLLKWRYQANRRSDSWAGTISEQRLQIAGTLEDSPSLRAFASEALAWAYGWARRDAARETRLPQGRFPTVCPFGIDEILDPDFFPNAED